MLFYCVNIKAELVDCTGFTSMICIPIHICIFIYMYTQRYTHARLTKRKSSAGLLIVTANNNWCLWFWILQHAPVCMPFILRSTRGAKTGSCLHGASPSRPRRCTECCCLQRCHHFCPKGIPFSPTPVSSRKAEGHLFQHLWRSVQIFIAPSCTGNDLRWWMSVCWPWASSKTAVLC